MPNEVTDSLQCIFQGSALHLPSSPLEGYGIIADTGIWQGSMALTVSTMASIVFFLLFYSDIIEVAPLVLGCFAKWKENVNIYDSASLNRCRNRAFLALIPPVILICARYGLYPPAASRTPGESILVCLLAFLAYFFVRIICALIFKGRSISSSDFRCARSCVRTFFIGGAILMIATVGILLPFNVSDNTVNSILIWEIAAVYFIFIIRKTQIFFHFRGIFAAFLYLCTLEFLPTWLLTASVQFLQNVN